MTTKPTQPGAIETESATADAMPAINIEQWQMEIDNFIDETSTELNEIAKALDNGPITEARLFDQSETSEQASRPETDSTSEHTAGPASSSDDRFAKLKQRFATRMGKSKDEE